MLLGQFEPDTMARMKETSMSLEKGMLAVLTAIMLVAVPTPSRAQPAQITDSFPGSRIDPAIWHGLDNPGDSGTSDVDITRGITNGQLVLGLTSYGKTASNAGSRGGASNRLRLNDPADLTQLRARVTVQQAGAQPCAANTTASSRARVRFIAAFFNNGSSSGPNDQSGDVQATLQMVLDSGHGATPSSRVFELDVIRCTNPNCSTATSLAPTVTFAHTWTTGQAVRIALVWDKPNHQIVGIVNRGLSSQEVQSVSYLPVSDGCSPAPCTPPGGDLKELSVTTLEANCTAARRMSQITALFDNFFAQ
jgi:hypothetical protein